jgi:hypothetical protein
MNAMREIDAAELAVQNGTPTARPIEGVTGGKLR